MIDQDSLTATDTVGLPRLDAPAPYFEGRSTHGQLRLTDYGGKWLVLFAHPADFTPVCASELVAFERSRERFTELNCELVGLSVDSVYAHLAWREAIQERFGVTLGFPILEDVTMEISKQYGMLRSAKLRTGDVRALFVIDPRSVLRAMLYYPQTTGRSVSEVLRLLQALQISDELQVVTPEGWTAGQEVVEPAPQTVAAAQARRELSYGCVDWYYYKRAAAKV
jgi:peroxiredoxin (alkyl hydroperoxide reductase subunit C)